MTALDVNKATRPQLVAEAKKRGFKVYKSQSDDEIREMLAGANKFNDISAKDVEKAATVSAKLHVVNRTQDCFGLAFDPEDDACTTRCPLASKCVKTIIEKTDFLLADERARAKDEASHKEAQAAFNKGKGPNPGAFQPKPVGAYAEGAKASEPAKAPKGKAKKEEPIVDTEAFKKLPTEASKATKKIGGITPESKVKVVMKGADVLEMDNKEWRTVCKMLVAMKADVATYEDFEMVVEEASSAFKKPWKPDVIKEFAKQLRGLGHVKVG